MSLECGRQCINHLKSCGSCGAGPECAPGRHLRLAAELEREYGHFLTHTIECRDCGDAFPLCASGQPLWRAFRQALWAAIRAAGERNRAARE